MEIESFWEIVDVTGARSGAPMADRVEALERLLADSDDLEVRGFAEQLVAAQVRAYRWDLWAAAYVALGGCGDDGFLDFRSWLIAQGRDVFERVLAEPDALADLSWDEDEEDFGDAEAWAAIADEEWRRRHDQDLPTVFRQQPNDPAGEEFPEDDPAWFREHLPRLSARWLAA